MSRIIINGRFLCHHITGVERYARELVAELDKIVKPGEIEMAIPPEIDSVPEYKNIPIKKVGVFHNRLWEHISFPIYVMKRKAVSLNLCNVSPLLSPGIVCIMDTKIKAHPEFFSWKFLLWYRLIFANGISRSKKIITISDFSKKEICKYYNVDKSKINVVPCAWQHFERIKYDENALEKYGLKNKNYCFSMCSLEPNKNFKWIAEIAKKYEDIIFVISGSINKKVFANGMGFECPDNVKLIGYITDEEAKSLMRDCSAFLFPTFYEGFGMPPLEALSAGCKCVVVSDTEIMHEIFGDSVMYIDPFTYTMPAFITHGDISAILNKYDWRSSAMRLKQLIEI